MDNILETPKIQYRIKLSSWFTERVKILSAPNRKPIMNMRLINFDYDYETTSLRIMYFLEKSLDKKEFSKKKKS